MIKKALEYIVGLGELNTLELDGRTFVDKTLHEIKEPEFPTMTVSSIEAIVTYIREVAKEEVDVAEPLPFTDDKDANDYYAPELSTPLIVTVESPTKISVRSIAWGDGTRDWHIIADCDDDLPQFKYGSWYDLESFNIALQSRFIDNDDRAALLRFTSAVVDENSVKHTDDGIGQTTTVKVGVATVGEAKVPNPVALKPYRTFLDVEQPESKFIFRVREGGQCAIFEADGGRWKMDAKSNIYNYLQEKLSEKIMVGDVVLMK